MFEMIWNELLFRPLLNLLIGLYNTIGFENLGLAIIWLTLIVRTLLLPFSMQDKKRAEKQAFLETELTKLAQSYKNNPSVLREEQRKLMKQMNFRRWPKIILLGVQGIILVILYQVFLGGIKLVDIVDELYSFVDIPTQINTVFLGVDIANRSFMLSLICGIVLFLSIVAERRKSGLGFRQGDLLYFIGFPLSTFLILWYLAAVKALFILISLFFTLSLRFMRNFRTIIKHQETMMAEKRAEEDRVKQEGLPHIKDRF